MTWKKFKQILSNISAISFLIITVLFAIYGIVNCFRKNKTITIKETDNIEAIKLEKENIIIEIHNLDSIKNEKIIEVKNLDNDSTLKLFYELIGK